MTMFNNLFSFYRSKEWEALREAVVLERGAVCEYCHKPIVKAYDAICHHKTELTEANVNDYNVSLNADNIMVVHHKCHNDIHQRFGTFTRHIYIVWGSPCSGKSAYVNEAAGKDDLIIDIDRIYSAVNLGRSGRIYGNVMELYRQMIDMVRCRSGRWANAWIVRGFPLSMDRERLANELGAELIHIDTSREECEAEAMNRGGDWSKWVADWWSKYRE